MEAEGVTYDSTARHEPQYGVILSGAGACTLSAQTGLHAPQLRVLILQWYRVLSRVPRSVGPCLLRQRAQLLSVSAPDAPPHSLPRDVVCQLRATQRLQQCAKTTALGCARAMS